MNHKVKAVPESVSVSSRVGRICVKKFNDLNGNGVQDPGDPLLPGFVFIVKEGLVGPGKVVGQVKAGECLEVKPGTYTVAEQIQPGWTPTTLNQQTVTVSPGKTVNLVFGNKRQSEDPCCCQFELRLYNTLSNTIEKIEVIPADPQAVLEMYNEEVPDYTLTKSGNKYSIKPAAGFFPADPSQFLDLDFAIKVDPTKSPTSVTVRWIDATDQVRKEELLELDCQKSAGEEEGKDNWFKKRKTIRGVDDNVAFAGAEIEDCEDFDKDEKASVCGFDHEIKCSGGQDVLVLTATYEDASSYLWIVNDMDTPTQLTGRTVIYNLTEGAHPITVSLTITYPDPGSPGQNITENCSDAINVCIPTADFSLGTPKANCVNGQLHGYNVDITPLDQDCSYSGSPSIAQATLDFGDGTPVQNLPLPLTVTITHEYEVPCVSEYNVELLVTDIWGCIHKKKHSVKISKDCEPLFHLKYELCETQETAAVKVTFVNDTQVFCNSKFMWNFGDSGSGSNQITTALPDPVSHTYHGAPQDYTVILTMYDDPCTAGKSITATFTLKPISVSLKALVCPDGETHFICQSAGEVTWALSPTPANCWFNITCANLLHKKKFTCDLQDGVYVISSTATETVPSSNPLITVTRTCTKEIKFTVTKICCDDYKVKDHRDFSKSSKNYRMKFKDKVVKETIGSDTRIVGKTKFKLRKKINILGLSIFYYKGIKATQISVDIVDNLFTGGPHPDDPTVTCKSCMNLTQFTGNDTRFNSSKAKVHTSVSQRGTRKDGDLTSLHYVSYDGWEHTIKVQKPVNQMCNSPIITEW